MEQSGVGGGGGVVTIPRSHEFLAWALEYVADPLALALGGGEDYELLFSVSRKRAARCLD